MGGTLFSVKYFYKPLSPLREITNPTPIISPTAMPTIAPVSDQDKPGANYEMIADKLMPLWRYLPYQGKGFLVENYLQEGVLIIRLQGATKAQAAVAIKAWMESHGVEAKTHSLEWR